jgi:hypothetical protein
LAWVTDDPGHGRIHDEEIQRTVLSFQMKVPGAERLRSQDLHQSIFIEVE